MPLQPFLNKRGTTFAFSVGKIAACCVAMLYMYIYLQHLAFAIFAICKSGQINIDGICMRPGESFRDEKEYGHAV